MRGFHYFVGILALSPVWITVAHSVVTRLGIRRSSNQAAALFACAISSIPVGAALWASYLRHLEGSGLFTGAIYAALLYGLLAYSYFHVFNMGETARRVRMLVELTGHGEMKTGELRSFYNTRAILDRRVERLASLGQLRLDGDRIVLISKRLFLAASLMSLWCSVLGLPPLKGIHPDKQ